MKQPRQGPGLLRSKGSGQAPARVQSAAWSVWPPSRPPIWVVSTLVERLLLITNADAGTNDEEAVDAALEVLRRAADVEVAATSSPDELEEVLAKRDGRDLVVAGGDGSLHAVVAALHASDDLAGPTVGLIPLGTGNDFARGVRIPSTRLGRQKSRPVDRRRRSTSLWTTRTASSSTPCMPASVPRPVRRPSRGRSGSASSAMSSAR